jgi:ABC-2 type transport system permease protein
MASLPFNKKKSKILVNGIERLSPYYAMGRVAFLQILAYRLRYFTGIVTYLVNVTVYYFIWKALYRQGGEIQGFRFGQMITYVSVGWIIRTFYFNNIDREMANDILHGHIASKLSRPVNYQWMQIFQAAGESYFRILFFTIPAGLAIILIYPVEKPVAIGQFLFFLISIFLAFLIFAAFNFMVGTCAVYLQSILGLIRAKYFLVEILSGLIIPISFFPTWMRTLSTCLPFQHISFSPLMIYMGKITGWQLAETLFVEMAWSIGLLILGQWFWRKAVHKLVVQGG